MIKKTPIQRHRWFDDWRYPAADPLHDLAFDIAAELDRLEKERRMRRRRSSVECQREQAIAIIVANLAHAVLVPPDTGRLGIVLGKVTQKPSRYRSPASGRLRTLLIDQLEELGLLSVQRSRRRAEASSIAPTGEFCTLMMRRSITDCCIGRLAREETVVVKTKPNREQPTKTLLIDYPDTAETIAMRKRIEALNEFISEADITFLADGLGTVDVHDRVMRRKFRCSSEGGVRLDENGRLFGGFWQRLKRERRSNLRINGERCAEVDYSSMFARLAYANVMVEPPPGDLYAIPGLEPYRPAVKLLINAMFFDEHRRRSWPHEGGIEIPPEWSVGKARRAILERHPALDCCFGVGLGHTFMFKESEIILTVLDELREMNVVALNLHDGVIVAHSDVDIVRATMTSVSERLTGRALPVAVKPGCPSFAENTTTNRQAPPTSTLHS